MPRPLGDEEFATLQQHSDAGDRIAYYSQLEHWGNRYGGLALSVVNNDTLSGATATLYFLDEAGDQGVSVSNDQLTAISLQLMRADLRAREAFGDSANGEELPVKSIKDYHQTIFDALNISDNAWTPNFAIESFDTVAEQEQFWDQLLAASNPLSSAGILISATEGDTSLEAIAWRAEVTLAGATAILSDNK